MTERKEVRLAGAGSHGMIEAGLILQEAAAIYDDMNAHHVQSYGPEARSNAARSEVIISHADIDYPRVTKVDLLLATTQEAVERYGGDLKPGAFMILDEEVEPPESTEAQVYRLPLARSAEGDLGKPELLHVVALGAMVEFSEVVTKPALEAAVKDHVPRGAEGIYQRALEVGYDLGRRALGKN